MSSEIVGDAKLSRTSPEVVEHVNKGFSVDGQIIAQDQNIMKVLVLLRSLLKQVGLSDL